MTVACDDAAAARSSSARIHIGLLLLSAGWAEGKVRPYLATTPRPPGDADEMYPVRD